MWFAVRGRWRQMILLFLIVRRTPTIRELIVATPLSLSSPSVTGLSAHAPAQRLERSDFVLRRAQEPKFLLRSGLSYAKLVGWGPLQATGAGSAERSVPRYDFKPRS